MCLSSLKLDVRYSWRCLCFHFKTKCEFLRQKWLFLGEHSLDVSADEQLFSTTPQHLLLIQILVWPIIHFLILTSFRAFLTERQLFDNLLKLKSQSYTSQLRNRSLTVLGFSHSFARLAGLGCRHNCCVSAKKTVWKFQVLMHSILWVII